MRRGLGKLVVVTGLLGSRWQTRNWQRCLVKTRAWKLGRGTALDRAVAGSMVAMAVGFGCPELGAQIRGSTALVLQTGVVGGIVAIDGCCCDGLW